METLVSVIIPTYNEEKDIEDCLKSLKKQSYNKFEIIVVDDGSTDKTLEIVKRFKKAKILRQRHLGPGLARNLGVKKAEGDIIILIDSDMTFDKDYIKNLIKPILRDKKEKIIGTTHDYEVATNLDKKWSILWGKVRVSKKNAKDVKIFRAIRKNSFLKMGGFDPKYGYADDQTFWFKYKIMPKVAKNTTCYHKNPTTLRGTYKQARWIGASWKERYKIFKIPLVNYLALVFALVLVVFIALAKSIKKIDSRLDISWGDRLRFYLVKFYGYFVGLGKAVLVNKFSK